MNETIGDTILVAENELGSFLESVKCLITDSVLPLVSSLPSTYQELLRQHFTGGKLVRTQAMFLLSRCIGRNDIDCLTQTASALELIHRSTLLVDDMVDHSSSRNEAQAAHLDLGLTKTVFISHIFTAMGTSLCPDFFRQDLLYASEQLNLGQLSEHTRSYNFTSVETVFHDFVQVASLKSGSLGMFALLAALGDKYRSNANEFGIKDVAHHLAVAYQIANDLDNLTPWIQSNVEEIPSDVANGSPSLPLLLARHLSVINQAHPCEFKLGWNEREDYLRGLLHQSDIIQRCYQYMSKSLEAAMAHINSSWPANPYSQLFLKLCSSKWLCSYLGTASNALKWQMINITKEENDEHEQ